MTTKLAAHVQNPTNECADHLRRAIYPAIKCMGKTTPQWLSDNVLRAYGQANQPQPFIWRREHTDGIRDECVRAGVAGARRLFEATIRNVTPWREITDTIEIINEFIPHTDDDMKRLDECEAELCRLFYGEGFRLMVGNFAVGWPQLRHWLLYTATLTAVRQTGGFLGLHEYGWPQKNAAGQDLRWFEWHVLRYRKALDIIRGYGFGDIRIILSEIGWDGALVGGDNRGFRTLDWQDQQDYFQWLARYDAEIETDSKVQFASIFQTGANPDWQSFDIVGKYVGNSIADYTRVAALNSPPPPEPWPPPEKEHLPENETATDAPTLAEKVRWWVEEETRQREQGNLERANAIRYSLINRENGLLYRLERVLKGQPIV